VRIKPPDRVLPLFIAVFLAGFSAFSAQIVFLRELLVLFYGNELSLGVVLGCWLFWTGLGSLGLGRISDRFHSPAQVLAAAQTLLAFVLVLTLPAIRSAKVLLGLAPGQIAGYGSIFLVSLSVLFRGGRRPGAPAGPRPGVSLYRRSPRLDGRRDYDQPLPDPDP